MTPLDKTIKRALTIDGAEFVVTLTPESVKLTQKGRRHGVELAWAALISGDSALAVALQASVGRIDAAAAPAARNMAVARNSKDSATAPRDRATVARAAVPPSRGSRVNRKARS